MPEPDFITVDSRGRRLAYSVLGSGTPTVVLEAGLGGTIEHWRRLPGDLAPLVRVVIYDRAGLGASDPGPVPRTSQNMVADL
ncbi:MAG: alpha/beta fold hydrolase, partial [Thermomicrobiales bacterium]